MGGGGGGGEREIERGGGREGGGEREREGERGRGRERYSGGDWLSSLFVTQFSVYLLKNVKM